MSLQIKIQKQLADFSLDVEWEVKKEIGVIFGYSGAGKSLSLQLIAGLLAPDSGRIQADGNLFFDSATGLHLPPQKRRLGYVFQDSSLFPHMSVADNIRFGLRDKDAAAGEKHLLEMARQFDRRSAAEVSASDFGRSEQRWRLQEPLSVNRPHFGSMSRVRLSTTRSGRKCASF